jgi:hypothetical protein
MYKKTRAVGIISAVIYALLLTGGIIFTLFVLLAAEQTKAAGGQIGLPDYSAFIISIPAVIFGGIFLIFSIKLVKNGGKDAEGYKKSIKAALIFANAHIALGAGWVSSLSFGVITVDFFWRFISFDILPLIGAALIFADIAKNKRDLKESAAKKEGAAVIIK